MGTPGQLVVNRYRLVRALGQGGMGTVWEGHDDLLDRTVALKEVLPLPGLRHHKVAEFVHRVTLTASAATRVSDRSLVAVYDVAEEDGRPWIIMELFPSRSLDHVVANDGRLTPARAAEIGRRVIEALSATHAAGLVHGDVKPANILIGYTGRIVLSDLGVVVPGGTPGFRAPEGADAGPAADLWSLGATLYTSVVGRPFVPGTGLDLAPEVLRPVLWGLLSDDPGKRLKAAEADRMLADLAPAIASAPPRRRRRRRTGLIAGVTAVLAVGVVAVGGWALMGSASTPPTAESTPVAIRTSASAPPLTPTPSPSPTLVKLPLKWYKPGTGWQAAYPRGWKLAVGQDRQEWTAPDGTAHLGVQVIDWGGRDPMTVLGEVEASAAASAKAYRKIRLERITFAGAQAAEWEGRWKAGKPTFYPWSVKGVIYHETRRVIYTRYTTTILSWVTVDGEWERLKPTMDAVFQLYQVPKGDLTAPPQ